MTNKPATQNHASYGVETLIERLRSEGVTQGQTEGDAIIQDAKQRAASLISDAKREAEQIKSKARQEAKAMQVAGQDALKLAARDTLLKLTEALSKRFSVEVRNLVKEAMKPEPFMEKLILQLVAQTRDNLALDEQEQMMIELPESIVDINELRKNPEEIKQGTLSHLVVSLTAKMLNKGVSYRTSGDISGGIKVYLQDGDIEVELTDEALAAVLVEHLQPRFRALMEGVIK